MRKVTILKFGAFSFLLVAIPLLMAVGFFYIHEAHTSTYYGFFIGLVIDGILHTNQRLKKYLLNKLKKNLISKLIKYNIVQE